MRLPSSHGIQKMSISGLTPRCWNFPGYNSRGISSLAEIISWSGFRWAHRILHKLSGLSGGPLFEYDRIFLGCVRPSKQVRSRAHHIAPSARGSSVCCPRPFGTPVQKGSQTLLLSGVLRGCSRLVTLSYRGPCHPLTEWFPSTIPHLRARVSRHRGQCLTAATGHG